MIVDMKAGENASCFRFNLRLRHSLALHGVGVQLSVEFIHSHFLLWCTTIATASSSLTVVWAATTWSWTWRQKMKHKLIKISWKNCFESYHHVVDHGCHHRLVCCRRLRFSWWVRGLAGRFLMSPIECSLVGHPKELHCTVSLLWWHQFYVRKRHQRFLKWRKFVNNRN